MSTENKKARHVTDTMLSLFQLLKRWIATLILPNPITHGNGVKMRMPMDY